MLQGAVGTGNNRTDSAVVNQPLGFAQFGIKAVSHTHEKHSPRCLGCTKHTLRFRHRGCHWLLHQYVLTPFQSLDGHLAMQMCRQTDAHRIDVAL
jgi:hypothetical protein